jgi:hypothetical protein
MKGGADDAPASVNAGAKMHRRTGVKMHHDGPAAGTQLFRSIYRSVFGG